MSNKKNKHRPKVRRGVRGRRGVFRFLDLPMDVRFMVYDLLTPKRRAIIDAPPWFSERHYLSNGHDPNSRYHPDRPKPRWTRPRSFTALLCVNRQIYHEASPRLYQSMPVVIVRVHQQGLSLCGKDYRFFYPGGYTQLSPREHMFANLAAVNVQVGLPPEALAYPPTLTQVSILKPLGDAFNGLLAYWHSNGSKFKRGVIVICHETAGNGHDGEGNRDVHMSQGRLTSIEWSFNPLERARSTTRVRVATLDWYGASPRVHSDTWAQFQREVRTRMLDTSFVAIEPVVFERLPIPIEFVHQRSGERVEQPQENNNVIEELKLFKILNERLLMMRRPRALVVDFGEGIVIFRNDEGFYERLVSSASSGEPDQDGEEAAADTEAC
ncbi:hypothetical protein BJ546DRAFT_176219 [Cryomyces antarcticus]